jgi:hypothetical protein
VAVVICLILSLITQWVIRIPQAGLDTAFGFQVPVVWLIVFAIAAALLATNLTVSLTAALAAEALLVGWFGWATWLATTSRFAGFEFPFMGIDLIAPGWFIAVIGLVAAGTRIAQRFRDLKPHPENEVWLLALLPGLGLVRLDHIARGAVYAVLVLTAVFLASMDSQVTPLFRPVAGAFEAPPRPPNRTLEWVFLSSAGAVAALSVIETARTYRTAARR